MNFLAHLLLPGPDDDLRLGGLIGDFMQGHPLEGFDPGIQRGIRLHREIDRRTDAHPVFRQSRERIAPRVGRFSGVAVDVIYDHFLASGFERWHPSQPLPEFTQEIYGLLEARRADLPRRLEGALPWLIGEDWLASYADLAHVERAFHGMSRRVKRDNPLAAATAALEENYDALGNDFAEFFPALRASLDPAHSA